MSAAVVFDLFGTLVTYPPGAPHVRAMARSLGIAFEALHPPWRKLRAQRDAGELDTLAALRLCCEELRIQPNDRALEAACSEAAEFFQRVLTPRPGALTTLSALRARQFRVGLVSDANIEAPRQWSTSPLAGLIDVAVFSSVERVRKPHPSLYRAVCERLRVRAVDCLYVGNGDGDELAGATTAGMRAVLFTAPSEFQGREAAEWSGRRISDLSEVLTLVDEFEQASA